MRLLCDLWASVRGKDIEQLRKLVVWMEKDVSYRLKTPEGVHDATLAHATLPGMSMDMYSRGDVVQPAYDALRREINLRLAEAPIVPQMLQQVHYRPPHLLAAMWLQLAEAVAGGFDFYPCDSCGKFYQRGQGGGVPMPRPAAMLVGKRRSERRTERIDCLTLPSIRIACRQFAHIVCLAWTCCAR